MSSVGAFGEVNYLWIDHRMNFELLLVGFLEVIILGNQFISCLLLSSKKAKRSVPSNVIFFLLYFDR